ncbi:MAG: OsmC family protein [Proteobacteria bacterium]|nr:OsmC family protein [Pseudomonadota bacterium]
MQDLPHRYVVTANAAGAENVVLSSDGIPDLETAGPPQFGGPGDVWSPETLLVGAVSDCFVLSFRAVARKARLDWVTLTATADGTLDKVDGFTRFTSFAITAQLTIPPGTSESKATAVMQKAEKYCLITKSLQAESTLETSVRVEDAAANA